MQEEVDMRALPLLSGDDLIYLGVTSMSQRKTLLAAAMQLVQKSIVPARPDTSTSQQSGRLPTPQGSQSEAKSLNRVSVQSEQGPRVKEHKEQHDQSSRTNFIQKSRPLKQSRKCTAGRAANISASGGGRKPAFSTSMPKRQGAPSAARRQCMPEAAQRNSAASSEKQPISAQSRDVTQPADSIVPDSDEDSDFADGRPAPRLPPARKKAKTSAGLPSGAPVPGGGQPQSRAANAEPATKEEERDQLERALALSLSAQGESGSRDSEPSSLSSTNPTGAAQHAPSMQPPGYLSGALGRVLAARNSRGRVSQNRSYSRQTEQRLLEALYPTASHAPAGPGGSSGTDAAPRVDETNGGQAADQSGWSSDEDADQKKESSTINEKAFGDNGTSFRGQCKHPILHPIR